jgi:iron complex transport system substrate-binding protein
MRRAPASKILASLLVVIVAGVACGDDALPEGAAPDSTRPPGASSAATTGPTTTSPPAFPVTVRSGQGDVTIESQPKRIVSLSPSLTEMLYAVDAGPQVVAVDQNSDHPPSVPKTDLSGLRPNIEAIAKYEPDLVVVARDNQGVVAALSALKIDTLLLPSAVTIDDVYREINVVGQATGHRAKAEEVVAGMRAELDAIAKSAPSRPRQARYFYELTTALDSPTSDTFIGALLRTIGLASIADAAGAAAGQYPKLSNEFVLDADPDVILVAHTDGKVESATSIKARPGWDKLQAVRNNRVVILESDIASRWGPRIVTMLRTIADATKAITT